MKKLLLVTLVLVGLLATGVPARADVYTLADRNSSAVVNTGLAGSSGMVDWFVDNVNYLFQQWFWVRTNTPGALAQQVPLNNLPLIGAFAASADGRTGDEILTLQYGSATGLEIDVRFVLAGGLAGTNVADISETISLNNHGRTALSLSFFEYSDFDLSPNMVDTVSMSNANTVRQVGTALALSETVVTPVPARAELGLYASTLNSLNSTPGYNLNNQTAALTGDVTWAFQWDFNLAAGGTVQISKDKNLAAVPEPGSMLLLGTGLFGLAGAVRRRFKK